MGACCLGNTCVTAWGRKDFCRSTYCSSTVAMGGFFSKLFDRLSGIKEARLLMLGLDGAGKTSKKYKFASTSLTLFSHPIQAQI